MKKISITIYIFALMLGTLSAQSVSITTKGLGSVIQDDIATARDQAIDDALRRAVQQALGTEIESSTLVRNFQLAEDNILSWSRGYVANYEIIEEGQQPYDVYEVVLQAEVKMADLRADDSDTQSLMHTLDQPRILVIIDEQNMAGNGIEGYFSQQFNTAENTIINLLRENGLDVRDAATLKDKQYRDEVVATLSGDTQAAAAVAARVNAEIIITGKAVSRASQNYHVGGLLSCQANISLRAIKADIASIIHTVNENAAYPHVDEITGGVKAMERAARKAAENLMRHIVRQAEDEFYNFQTIEFQIQNVDNLAAIERLLSHIRYSIRGVKAIRPREFVSATSIYDITLTGNGRQFARELAVKSFDVLQFNIESVSQNQVTIRVENN